MFWLENNKKIINWDATYVSFQESQAQHVSTGKHQTTDFTLNGFKSESARQKYSDVFLCVCVCVCVCARVCHISDTWNQMKQT